LDKDSTSKRSRTETLRSMLLSIKKNKACYAMIAPFMLFFLIFTVVPVVMSFPISFTDFNMAQPPKFVGLSNYTTLFLSDKIFLKSVRVTIVFTSHGLLMSLILSLKRFLRLYFMRLLWLIFIRFGSLYSAEILTVI